MLLLVRGITRRPGGLLAAATGAAFAVAILFKQPAVFDLVAVYVAVVLIGRRRDPELGVRSLGGAVRWLAALTAGGLGVAALLAVAVLLLGVWDEFWFYSVTYNTEYYAAPFSLGGLLAHAVRVWIEAARPAGIGWLAAAGGVAIVLGRRHRPASPAARLRLLPLMWACSSFLGVVSAGRMFPHYFIQMILPWCLLAGYAVQQAASLAAAWMRDRTTPAVLEALGWVTATVAAVWFVVLPWRAVSPASIERQAGWVVDRPTDAVAEYLREVTGPDDRIFVWGFYPIPYVLAKRLPASRFLYCTFVTGANVGGGAATEERPVPQAMEHLLDDLERNRPLYIVDTSAGGYFHWGRYPPENYPGLWALIEADYELDLRYRMRYGDDRFRLFVRRPQ